MPCAKVFARALKVVSVSPKAFHSSGFDPKNGSMITQGALGPERKPAPRMPCLTPFTPRLVLLGKASFMASLRLVAAIRPFMEECQWSISCPFGCVLL